MAKKLQLWLATAAVVVAICDAELTPDATEQFLRAHNEARAAVGVAPLQWSRSLASYASNLATHPPGVSPCNLFKGASSFKYGINQAVAFVVDDSPEKVVGSWVEEGRRYYNYGNNSCAEGHESKCESYTQVVWRKTVTLGCGKGYCGKDGSHNVCLYYPRGNVPGERPY